MRRILLATDLSVFGSFLMQCAHQLAVYEDTEIIVVHAVEPLGVFADALIETYVPPEMMAHVRREGMPAVMEAIRTQVMEALEDELTDAQLMRHKVREVIIERGHAADVILSISKEYKADLIVIGSSSSSDHGMPLGSVVSKVLQLSSIPVYMVPLDQSRTERVKLRKSA
ncbi:MAG: universal stress protein [Pseudomonadota bacterium]